MKKYDVKNCKILSAKKIADDIYEVSIKGGEMEMTIKEKVAEYIAENNCGEKDNHDCNNSTCGFMVCSVWFIQHTRSSRSSPEKNPGTASKFV